MNKQEKKAAISGLYATYKNIEKVGLKIGYKKGTSRQSLEQWIKNNNGRMAIIWD